MDSVGVFREGEIDGNPFHIFSFLFQTSFSSSSSSGEAATGSLGGDNLSLESPQQPLFLCSSLRDILKNSDFEEFLPYNAPPHFPITKTIDDGTCKHPLLPIFWCNNKDPNSVEFEGACRQTEMGTAYYSCLRCEKMFHKECVESPLVIQNHPSYPFLSFHLYHSRYNPDNCCIRCKLVVYGMFYHCPTNNLSVHPVCAIKPIPIFIDHPKRHPHALTFFPKQTSLLCDVCGLVQESFPTYVCVRCIFVVHQDCIYLPFVIKISRHPHRISFTSSLPSGNWSCGVCRKKIDNHCGAYSCNKCGGYFVHSKCAVREDVWDGKELEGVPEEPEEILEPFEKIADGIILHFTHGHHLKLEVSEVYNEHKFCQACILPIYEGNYYSCLDGSCDFVLHETCASSPRKIHHPLHAHPLTLKAIPGKQYGRSYNGYFKCEACERLSCGFVYEKGNYKIDVRCASVSEPFGYDGHEHPLFLSLDPTQERQATCRICRRPPMTYANLRKLSCIECDYVICFKCATLPYKARYKHDKHLLTFREGKEGSDVFDWCEMCETKVKYSSKDGFYECDICCTTLHAHCLLGIEPYMLKPGQTIKEFGECEDLCHILSNYTQSRPVCQGYSEDTHLCPQKVVFKFNDETFCSYRCFISIFCD